LKDAGIGGRRYRYGRKNSCYIKRNVRVPVCGSDEKTTGSSTINEHIQNIYSDGELKLENTMRKFGNSEFSTKPTNYYNLDMIISVGYRVKSQRGVQFRIWAGSIFKEYLKKGFVMDDERLKNLGGGGYFKELLERIRDIRTSEKVFYRQLLEIFSSCLSS
jgi:hypothetical protein